MRIGIVTEFACGLSWWKRLADEGNEVKVWSKNREHKFVGEGIVNNSGTFWDLLYWVRAGHPSMMLFDSSGLGDLAEEARSRGVVVVCGGKFMDRLEKDRGFGFSVAEAIGCKLPPYEDFNSFEECLAFAREMTEDIPVYFKSDRFLDSDATHGSTSQEELVEYLEYIVRTYGSHGKCMLQEKIDGIPLSTSRWWNGREWVGPITYTLEHKKFLAGDVGPSTGCSLNAVWFSYSEEAQVIQRTGWPNLEGLLRQKQAPPGLYDINSLVTPTGECYFLEWTPRLGYDSEMTSGRLIPKLGRFLYAVATGGEVPRCSDDLAYAIRLGVPPYPWEHSKKTDNKSCVGTFISGPGVGDLWSGEFIAYQVRQGNPLLEMACAEGIVGLVYEQGQGLSKMHEKALKFASKKLNVPGLLYRTDGDKVLLEDAKKLRAAGVTVHKDLFS